MVSMLTGESGEAVMVDTSTTPEMQVVGAVHETIMLVNSYQRLSRDAPVELGARCECMAHAIRDALAQNFGGAVDG